MNSERIPGISVSDYEHPLETKALENLKRTRGLGKVVSKFHELSFEKSIRLQYTGSCLLAHRKTYPQLTFLVDKACDMLEVKEKPNLYIHRSDSLQSFTIGSDSPSIILTTDMVDKLTSQELLFVIGREVAHIKSNHILYHEIGMILPQIIEAFSMVTLGLSSIVSAGLSYALLTWRQMAEYTADRGGLLVCQDLITARWMFAKWAGLPEKDWTSFNIDEFDWQAKNLEDINQKILDKIVGLIIGDSTWSVARMKEILIWVESDEYLALKKRLSVN